MTSLLQLLKFACEKGASDLHVVAGTPPCLRIQGEMIRVKSTKLTPDDTRRLCYSMLNDYQKSVFEGQKELDFSFEIKGLARFRANYFFQRGSVSGVFRRVPMKIPQFQDLGLPKAITELTRTPNGLVLICGPTGSGKTTTLAALVDKINSEKYGHIITLEDPIEFVHTHKKCIVNQREVGQDSNSYKDALRYVLRQDPDVCLIGEMRDLATIETALVLAETGHLVLSTLHTNSASQTINRIVSVFPSEHQERIRVILSFVLQGIVNQKLLQGVDGNLIMATEFLYMTNGVRNLIREGKIHQIESMMELGQSETGMVTFNQSLFQLLINKKITEKEAFEATSNVDGLSKMLKKAGF